MLGNILRRKPGRDPQALILSALWSFTQLGQEQISLTEIVDAASRIQNSLPVLPEPAEGFAFSADLLNRIEKLADDGYVYRYEYAHDGLLPRSYLELTQLGRGRAMAIAQDLKAETLALIKAAAEEAISRHRENWRLYARL